LRKKINKKSKKKKYNIIPFIFIKYVIPARAFARVNSGGNLKRIIS